MRPPAVEPAIESVETGMGRYWFAAPIVTLLVMFAYIAFIVATDNTNLGTTNGLWKTPAVSAWEHGKSSTLDSGGFLYFPTYGTLARLIPDRLVEYGTPAPVVTFRKTTILNGIFGGIASGLVFLLALRFSGSPIAACLIALTHAGAGFVLLNSVNSEDIIPAYTFFLGATVCFFEFLHRARPWLFLLAAALMALATLFHWTVMPPALAAFGAVLLMAMWRRKAYIWISALWLFLYSCAVQILLLLYFPSQHIPVWAALLPTKGTNAKGWVGLSVEKIQYLVIGIGNYFSGANNDASYLTGLRGTHLHYVILSWLFFVPAIGACIVTLFARGTAWGARLLAVFALALLAAGEAGAFYSQPQDPQMQIQPMFAAVLGLVLGARRIMTAGLPMRRIAAAGLAGVAFANTADNVYLLHRDPGGDSRSLTEMRDFEALFPIDTTVVVCHGFEGWTTWRDVVLLHGDSDAFLARTFGLAEPFTQNRGVTGQEAAGVLRNKIDAILARGQRVVAGALWTEKPENFAASLTTVTSDREARAFDSILRASYRTGKTWQTGLGAFVELLPLQR